MATRSPDVDASLLQRIAARDQAAFGELFDHWAPRLRVFLIKGGAREIEADELVQEVMLTVWRKAGIYDRDRAAPSTWMFTIARNRRIDRYRRQRRPEYELDDPVLVASDDPRPDERVAELQRSQRLRAALDRLPADQAAVLRGTYFEHKSQSQVAAVHEVPLGTIKSRTRLAMGALRRILGEFS
jgi:RNA polymerase sigma-70 factor (ECF subfamily)